MLRSHIKRTMRHIHRVRLGVTILCILALPRVTLGVTAKEVTQKLREILS